MSINSCNRHHFSSSTHLMANGWIITYITTIYNYMDPAWLFLTKGNLMISFSKLYMSAACRRLKSPWSLSGTSAHPTMVTLVNIMVMNGWLTYFLFIVNHPPHSWDKAISNFDLETPRSRSWVWSKGKVIELAQYHINSLLFHYQQFRR